MKITVVPRDVTEELVLEARVFCTQLRGIAPDMVEKLDGLIKQFCAESRVLRQAMQEFQIKHRAPLFVSDLDQEIAFKSLALTLDPSKTDEELLKSLRMQTRDAIVSQSEQLETAA